MAVMGCGEPTNARHSPSRALVGELGTINRESIVQPDQDRPMTELDVAEVVEMLFEPVALTRKYQV